MYREIIDRKEFDRNISDRTEGKYVSGSLKTHGHFRKMLLLMAVMLIFMTGLLSACGKSGGGSGSGEGGLTITSGELPDPSGSTMEKKTEAVTEKPTEKQTEKQTEASTEKKTEKKAEVTTEKQTEKPTEAVTEKKTEEKTEKQTEAVTEKKTETPASNLMFRTKKLRDQHYEKHGIEMGFPDAKSYLEAANEVISDPDTLHKIEKEDGDDVYYRERDNAFVVGSKDGYIRTFFYPSGGKDYFDRQ